MRLITVNELTHRGEHELRLLCTHLAGVLARTEAGSEDWRNVRASLENARRALALKRGGPRP
jgi:hypothetical protein